MRVLTLIKAVLTAGTLLLLALSFRYLELCRQELPLPEHWQQIRRGQLRAEVLARVPELNMELYNMKEIDQTHHFSQSPVFGRVGQYLVVRYGSDNRVSDIGVRTLTEHYRLFRNKRLIWTTKE